MSGLRERNDLKAEYGLKELKHLLKVLTEHDETETGKSLIKRIKRLLGEEADIIYVMRYSAWELGHIITMSQFDKTKLGKEMLKSHSQILDGTVNRNEF